MSTTIINPYIVAEPSGGGGGSVYDDPLILFHLDAENLYNGSNPADDASITEWDDISGVTPTVNFDTLVGSGGTYRAGGPNSKHYVQFASRGDGIRTTETFSSTQIAGSSRKELTVFFVLRFNSGVVYFKWETGTFNRMGAEGTARWDFPSAQASNSLTGWSSSLSSSWKILELVSDGTTKYVYLDGVQVASEVFGQGSDVQELVAGTSATFWLGTNNTSGTSIGAIVDYAEVIYYSGDIGSTKRDEVRAALQAKYAL